jgi:hypothetical protein
MIIAFEMDGLNDTRPFLLTFQHGPQKFYSLEIDKNMSRADLEAGWNVSGEKHNFHITLKPCKTKIEDLKEEDNGEHRYWSLHIVDVFGDEPKEVGSGVVSWGEFFVVDGLREDEFFNATLSYGDPRPEEDSPGV